MQRDAYFPDWIQISRWFLLTLPLFSNSNFVGWFEAACESIWRVFRVRLLVFSSFVPPIQIGASALRATGAGRSFIEGPDSGPDLPLQAVGIIGQQAVGPIVVGGRAKQRINRGPVKILSRAEKAERADDPPTCDEPAVPRTCAPDESSSHRRRGEG